MRPALYYALGGGLGHITRARAILAHWDVEARIITRADLAAHPRISNGLDLLPVPVELEQDNAALRRWLEAVIRNLSPSVIYLDSFPAGLFGEFCGMHLPKDTRLEYIARLLRWDVYRQLLTGPVRGFSRTHLLEPLDSRHELWVKANSQNLSRLDFKDPPAPADPDCLSAFMALSPPRWLIVHSGNEAEIEDLMVYALEQAQMEALKPNICLASPKPDSALPAAVKLLDCYPLTPLFRHAERIISACGFNTMRQTEAFRERHRFLPMQRHFDDQFTRAALRRQRLSQDWMACIRASNRQVRNKKSVLVPLAQIKSAVPRKNL